ncbi:hypothetical protein AVEN_184394-1 [Araneus ventricosus]|uniref:Uncharacterized protein n=1 Tax=Araneus ventricosus TaxID=182803 RepID=A0A4Y2BFK6_ARAVE|nr:hypothetical protein AVEN_184394-1 [Araneus ventricosus]
MSTPYEKEIERLLQLLAEVETDEESDFDNENNGPEDVLEENFSDHESFSGHDTESEKDGDSGNEEGNNSEWFTPKDVNVQWRKENLSRIIVLVVIILCRVYLEQKNQRKM